MYSLLSARGHFLWSIIFTIILPLSPLPIEFFHTGSVGESTMILTAGVFLLSFAAMTKEFSYFISAMLFCVTLGMGFGGAVDRTTGSTKTSREEINHGTSILHPMEGDTLTFEGKPEYLFQLKNIPKWVGIDTNSIAWRVITEEVFGELWWYYYSISMIACFSLFQFFERRKVHIVDQQPFIDFNKKQKRKKK